MVGVFLCMNFGVGGVNVDMVSILWLVFVIRSVCFYCVDRLWLCVLMVYWLGIVWMLCLFVLIIGLIVKIMFVFSFIFVLGWL